MFCLRIYLVFVAFAVMAGDVENGERPSGTPMTLAFTEDLVIGFDPDVPETIWSGLNIYVTVNQDGHLFVTDSDENRIVQFDIEGNFVAVHGRQGQGPGEFQRLSRFQILDDGSGVAFENRQNATIHYFDDDMNFQKRKRIHSQGLDFLTATFSGDGELFASDFVVNNEQNATHTFRSGVYSRRMILKKIIAEEERAMPDFSNLLGNRNGIVEYLADIISANHQMALMNFDHQNHLMTALPQDYTVTVWDTDLNSPMRTVSRKYDPITKTPAEVTAICSAIHDQLPFPDFVIQRINNAMIQEAYEMAEVPLVKQAIFGLIPMEDGGLLVIHDFSTLTGEATADIFDAKGVFLGQVTMPNLAFLGPFNLFGTQAVRMVFRNGYAYTIEYRDDENTLVRYNYKLVPAQ